jgi:hypothetical protein
MTNIEKCQACDEDGWIAGGEDGDPIRCFHDEADVATTDVRSGGRPAPTAVLSTTVAPQVSLPPLRLPAKGELNGITRALS